MPLPRCESRSGHDGVGFRNLANYRAGLGGDAAGAASGWGAGDAGALAASESGVCGAVSSYSRRVLPVYRRGISGAPDAYKYLPESVRKFPEAAELARMMGEAGYARVEWES